MYKIPKELYIVNRDNVLSYFPKENSAILLKGGNIIAKYDTDREYVFEQESNFRYLFGINQPDCYGMINLNDRKTILFVSKKLNNLRHKYVNGPSMNDIMNAKKNYGIDEILLTDHLHSYLTSKSIKNLYILNSLTIDLLPSVSFDDKKLKNVLTKCRVIKSKYELNLMRKLNDVASAAHNEIQKLIHSGLNEGQLESLFNHHIYFYGNCRNPAYIGICASGSNASVLHYISNNKIMKSGELILIDMGADYCGYISDITQTIPVNRKFDKKQKEIYSIVLKILNAVLKSIKPGVLWTDIANYCDFMLTTELIKLGFLRGPMDLLLKHRLFYFFMPHRLAHFIGLDVHDVGELYKEFKLLKPGMTLAVEPGIYFNIDLMKNLKNSIFAKYVDFDKIAQYAYIGGIRIECNIIITRNGVENMTKVNRKFGL